MSVRSNRRFLCAFRAFVAIPLALWMVVLPSRRLLKAQSLELPLGLATGTGEAQLWEDGRKWTALTPASRLVLGDTVIRTGNGLAWAPLHDTTQFELHQCGVVGTYGSRAATVIKIAVGRVLFRLPAFSETVFATPNVQLRAPGHAAAQNPSVRRAGGVTPDSSDHVGWIIVDAGGSAVNQGRNANAEGSRWKTRIEVLQGSMLASPRNGRGQVVIDAGQRVDYLQNGNDIDPDFQALRDRALPCPCAPCIAVVPRDEVAASPVGFPVLGAGWAMGGLGAAGSALVVTAFGGGDSQAPSPASAFRP